MNPPPRPVVMLVTDRRQLAPDARTTRDEVVALERFLDEAIDALVDVIQVRERDLDAGLLAGLCRRVTVRARAKSTRVLVNDRADVALAAGADGVHLRERSLSVTRCRQIYPSWTVGRSLHAASGLAVAAEADYVLFGTVFPSASKRARAPVAGIAGLRAVLAASSIPVLAIGGIDAGGARACVEAGAAGVAAIRLFLPRGAAPGALGVRAAVSALRGATAGGEHAC